MIKDSINKVKSQSERVMAVSIMEQWLISRYIDKKKLRTQ